MRTLHMINPLECAVDAVVTTIRLGYKWADSFNQEIELCVCPDGMAGKHEIKGHGRVADLWRGSFKSVPARLLEQAQQTSSRSYTGCKENMRRAYRDDFHEDADVVIVTYLRTD